MIKQLHSWLKWKPKPKTLFDYVMAHTTRGACTCGKCFDAAQDPQSRQPTGHTIDLTFFKVAAANNPKKSELEKLVRAECPELFDGKEHSFINLGATLGDQGCALQLIALGGLLGLWEVLSPARLMPFLTKEEQLQIAGMGLVSLQARKPC